MRLRDVHFANVKSDVSVAQIEKLLTVLATLHAKYWESPRFETDLSWIEPHTSGAIYTMFNHPEMLPASIAGEIEQNQFKRELVAAAARPPRGSTGSFARPRSIRRPCRRRSATAIPTSAIPISCPMAERVSSTGS